MSKSIPINKIQIKIKINKIQKNNKKNRKISKHKKHLSNQKMKYLQITQFNNHPNILAMKSSNPYY